MSKLGRIAIAVVVVLAVATGTATATVNVSPAGNVEYASEGPITFTGSGISVSCDLTLSGDLLTSWTPTRGADEGTIDAVAIDSESCEGGAVSGVLSLSWVLDFQIFLGTLPAGLTGLLLTITPFQIQFSTFGGFINCLYSGPLELLVRLIYASGSNPWIYNIEPVKINLQNLLERVSGPLCPAQIRVSGRFRMSPSQRLSYS